MFDSRIAALIRVPRRSGSSGDSWSAVYSSGYGLSLGPPPKSSLGSRLHSSDSALSEVSQAAAVAVAAVWTLWSAGSAPPPPTRHTGWQARQYSERSIAWSAVCTGRTRGIPSLSSPNRNFRAPQCQIFDKNWAGNNTQQNVYGHLSPYSQRGGEEARETPLSFCCAIDIRLELSTYQTLTFRHCRQDSCAQGDGKFCTGHIKVERCL